MVEWSTLKGGSIQLQAGSSEGLAWTGRCLPCSSPAWLAVVLALAGSPSFSLPGPPHKPTRRSSLYGVQFPQDMRPRQKSECFLYDLVSEATYLTFILFCWSQSLPWFNVGGDNAKAWISWGGFLHWGPFGMLAATNDLYGLFSL